jgi:hypothetical protein
VARVQATTRMWQLLNGGETEVTISSVLNPFIDKFQTQTQQTLATISPPT